MTAELAALNSKVTLIHGDCLLIAPTLQGVAAVVTDPPYGIGFAAQPTTGGRKRGQPKEAWDDVPTENVAALHALAPLCAIWGGNYYPLPTSRGWLVWYKPDAPPSMGHAELCWTNLDQNVRLISWSIAATNAERVGHPTQKPVRVMSWTMEQIGVPQGRVIPCKFGPSDTWRNAVVLDPYMGSGTTAIACIRTGRDFIGIEIDEGYFNIAVERCKREIDGQLL